MAQKKDYPVRFLEIIAGIIKERKKRGLYSRETKLKRLEVRPKLSGKKVGVAKENSLKIANITIKKKRLPKKKNKYILIPIPKEKTAKKNDKSNVKTVKKSKTKKSKIKHSDSKKNLKKSKTKNKKSEKRTAKRPSTKTRNVHSNKTQNIVTLEPYINAQPKKVTISLDGVKQDSSQNKSEIPIKYPLEKIVFEELKGSGKTFKESTIRVKPEKARSSHSRKSKKKKAKNISEKKISSPKKRNALSTAQNKEELLSKIKTLEDWMAKVKGTVNDKTMKNLEKKLSSLKSRVSNMK